MICTECEKQQLLEDAWKSLAPRYLLCRLPNSKFCVVDAMACSMMEGQAAMVLQKVTGSDADTPLEAILKTIDILL